MILWFMILCPSSASPREAEVHRIMSDNIRGDCEERSQ